MDSKDAVPAGELSVVVSLLKQACEDRVDMGKPNPWWFLFRNGSYYTPSTSCALLTFDDISKKWSFLGKGGTKNYAREIERFFEWLMPYVDGEEGDFIGYSRYEENQQPELIYLKETTNE